MKEDGQIHKDTKPKPTHYIIDYLTFVLKLALKSKNVLDDTPEFTWL